MCFRADDCLDLRCRTGGVQEWIEGISFLYFLETDGGLIRLSKIQESASDSETGKPVCSRA